MYLLAVLLVLFVGSVAPQSAPVTEAASNQKAILTVDQQKKLAKLMVIHGHDVAMSQTVTAALGISKGDEVLTLRQLTTNEHPNSHSYIPLPNGGYLLIFADSIAWDYRLDAHFTLVAAVSKRSDQAPIVIPMKDAERNVEVELKYWAEVADRR